MASGHVPDPVCSSRVAQHFNKYAAHLVVPCESPAGESVSGCNASAVTAYTWLIPGRKATP